MSTKIKAAEIRGGYKTKIRHYRFLKRRLPPHVMTKLTDDFDSLWDIEGDRYFPRLMDFPSKARRLMHPTEEDHLAWDAVYRLNLEILDLPVASVKEKLYKWIEDPRKADKMSKDWDRLREIVLEQNKLIDRHMNTMLHLVTQCPGRWLERENHEGFRRLCNDLPRIIELMEQDVRLARRVWRDITAFTRKPLHVNILGIGEITTTIEVLGGRDRGLTDPESGRKFHYAVKKLPPFPSKERALRYGELFDEYQEILRDKVGLNLPAWGWKIKTEEDDRVIAYTYQERLPQHSNCAIIVKNIDARNCRRMFERMLDECKLVFDFNRADRGVKLGFDGQVPNWCAVDYDTRTLQISENEKLLYIDTSTPMMRRGGPDLLDTSIFLKTIPAPLRPIVRGTIMREVLDRYYKPRAVITDLIASFYLYERPDMVPVLVEDANIYMKEKMSEYQIRPFTEKEMASYHRQDTMIWVFFRAIKRFDRFVKERLLGRSYEQRLPDKRFVPGPFGQ